MKAYKTTKFGIEVFVVVVGTVEHTFFSVQGLQDFLNKLK